MADDQNRLGAAAADVPGDSRRRHPDVPNMIVSGIVLFAVGSSSRVSGWYSILPGNPETKARRAARERVTGREENLPDKSDKCLVLVTCANAREARRIALAVVRARHAACVNILPGSVTSVYRWKGKVETARERLLLIKTSRRRLAKLQRAVERLHSYDVPEFIAVPITSGSRAYLTWLDESL